MIEIGTGWGGFAMHTAEHYGCLCHDNWRLVRSSLRMQMRKLSGGVSGRIMLKDDYRKLKGQYDKLVSIEMIEAWLRLSALVFSNVFEVVEALGEPSDTSHHHR